MVNFNQEQDEFATDRENEVQPFGEYALADTINVSRSENEIGKTDVTAEDEGNSERKFDPIEARKVFEEQTRLAEEKRVQQERELEEIIKVARERFMMEAHNALNRIASQEYKGAELLSIFSDEGKMLGWKYSDDDEGRYLGENGETYTKTMRAIDKPAVVFFKKDLHEESKDFTADSARLAKAFPLSKEKK